MAIYGHSLGTVFRASLEPVTIPGLFSTALRAGGGSLARRLRDGFALEQFGDGVEDRAWRQRVRADVVDGEDVRVRERGDSLRFALKVIVRVD